MISTVKILRAGVFLGDVNDTLESIIRDWMREFPNWDEESIESVDEQHEIIYEAFRLQKMFNDALTLLEEINERLEDMEMEGTPGPAAQEEG